MGIDWRFWATWPGRFIFFFLTLLMIVVAGLLAALPIWLSSRRILSENKIYGKALIATLLDAIIGVASFLIARRLEVEQPIFIWISFAIVVLLSTFFTLKLIFHTSWCQTLALWGLSILLQLLIIPPVLIISMVIFGMLIRSTIVF